MRKSPVRHNVKNYRRDDGAVVHEYVRGNGSNPMAHMANPSMSLKKGGQSLQEIIGVMKQREIDQGFNPQDSYQGYTNWDTWETMLLLKNTQSSDRWLGEWKKNFERKIKGSRFNPAEAEKAVEKYIVPVARGKKKSIFYDQYHEFTPDENIDPKKVNKAEVIRLILERES